jgi:hypothetical protein
MPADNQTLALSTLTQSLQQIINSVTYNPAVMDAESIRMSKSSCQCLDQFSGLRQRINLSETYGQFYDYSTVRFCARYSVPEFGIKYQGQLDALALVNTGCLLLLLYLLSIVCMSRINNGRRKRFKFEPAVCFIVFACIAGVFVKVVLETQSLVKTERTNQYHDDMDNQVQSYLNGIMGIVSVVFLLHLLSWA